MGNCNVTEKDPLKQNVECPDVLDNNGGGTKTNNDCTPNALGKACPNNKLCGVWALADNGDGCVIDSYVNESINIGGAKLLVYKMLGVHEQGSLTDVTGLGSSISSGDIPNYPSQNAFNKLVSEWRSTHRGAGVVKDAYIGYDFGPFILDNGRARYGIETYFKKDISTIRIKQGCDSKNRVTKARVERSMDGKTWYGVDIVDLKDCDGLVTINFKSSVPSRYWRLRPIAFNGGNTDWWAVQALEFMEYDATNWDNIQDKIYIENRDRDYSQVPIEMKGVYQPIDTQSYFSKIGLSSLFGGTDRYTIEVGFTETVSKLGRPFVIGDIISLPSETQFTPDLKPVMKYLEVTDVAWSTNGYTPDWRPTMQRLIAVPATAAQETQDVFGDLTQRVGRTGLAEIDDGVQDKKYQDLGILDGNVVAQADDYVPENGEDFANVEQLSDDINDWASQFENLNIERVDRNRSVWAEDGMPPNGEPFTEGPEFPRNPKNGDYHRTTYDHLDGRYPPRLYRYSTAKAKWIYLETDRRYEHKDSSGFKQKFLDEYASKTKVEDIGDDIKGG